MAAGMAIRIFNCARCGKATKVCSCCDRGNWYCKRCAPIAERERIARAKYRYRHTFDGRSAAARRQARARRRRKEEKKKEGEGQLAAREAEAVDSTTDAVPGAGDLSGTSDTKPGTQDAPSCEKEALPLKESATEEAVAGTELELEEVDAEPGLQNHGEATALEPEIVTDRGRQSQSVSPIIPSWSGPGRPARGEDEAAPITTLDRTKEDCDAEEPSAGRSAVGERRDAPKTKRSTLVGGFSPRQAPSWHCCDFCRARWFGVPRVALIHRRLGRGPSPLCPH